GSEEAGITLSGLSATGDSDDTLSATLSGIPAGWSVRDGAAVLGNGQAFAASDLGSLVVSAPDNGGESALLTLTVRTAEGGGTNAVETLTVTASGVAEAPVFGTATMWSGSEEGGITLSSLSATGDSDDALSATLSGIPAGWSVRDGAAVLGNGQGFAASDLGSLVVSAPDQGGESALLTLTVRTAEGGGTSAVETLTVTASGVAEAPVFGTTTVWSGSEEAGITLSSLSATGDSDDTLSATLSGIPAGWSVRDGAVVLSNGQGFAAADLGSLVVSAPDHGGESALLTLTVSTAEGGGTSAVETLTVTASGVAEAPVFGTASVWSGSEEAGITLSSLSATGDADDTLSATLSGIPAGWSVRDGAVVLGNGQGFAAADLGSLVVSAPDHGGESALLTLTVSTAEG